MNVTIRPELLVWARQRAALAPERLARMLGTKDKPAPLDEWEKTGDLPFAKLEALAEKTHTPLGFLFLPEPPPEPLPIRDFRRPKQGGESRVSLGLLQTIYACQFRQSWMRARLEAAGENPLPFVGSKTIRDEVRQVAEEIRVNLGIGTDERAKNRTFEEATLWMMARFEEAGILVQRNGIVGNNTHRPLNKDEFKGFALSDRLAPLIFINGRDWPASQVFTLAHEAAHIWLGESGVTDADLLQTPQEPIERLCNSVAEEVLVPSAELRSHWRSGPSARDTSRELARRFLVSPLMMLVRARTAGLLSASVFDRAIEEERKTSEESAPKQTSSSSGGDYYSTAGTRLGKRFIREVLVSTLEGATSYADAFELLGTRKTSVFNGLVDKFLKGGQA